MSGKLLQERVELMKEIKYPKEKVALLEKQVILLEQRSLTYVYLYIPPIPGLLYY